MNVIVPFFPQNSLEKEVMIARLQGEAGFLHDLARHQGFRDMKIHCFADQQEIICLLKQHQLPVQLLQSPESDELPALLPFGAMAGIRAVAATVAPLDNDDLIVLNPLTGHLPFQSILTAYNRFLETDTAILLSVHDAHDHPAQLDAYYRIIDFTLLCLLDSNDTLAPMATKPFLFDWSQMGIHHHLPNNLYQCRLIDDTYAFLELRREKAAPATKDDQKAFEPLWESLNPHQARCLFPQRSPLAPLPSGKLTGFSLAAGSSPALLLAADNELGALGLYIRKPLAALAPLTIRLWGHRQDAPPHLTPMTTNPSPSRSFSWLGKRYIGPIVRFVHDQQVEYYSIAVLQAVTGSRADHVEPLLFENAPWRINTTNGKRFNTFTDKEICGRQDLPPVFEPDRTLFISKARYCDNLPDVLKRHGAEGFRLDSFATTSQQGLAERLRITNNHRLKGDEAKAGMSFAGV